MWAHSCHWASHKAMSYYCACIIRTHCGILRKWLHQDKAEKKDFWADGGLCKLYLSTTDSFSFYTFILLLLDSNTVVAIRDCTLPVVNETTSSLLSSNNGKNSQDTPLDRKCHCLNKGFVNFLLILNSVYRSIHLHRGCESIRFRFLAGNVGPPLCSSSLYATP